MMLWSNIVDLPILAAFSPTVERQLYFKLPVEGAQYHWRFLDADTFLAGELTLRIINHDRDDTLVVFRDGRIHDGWAMIGDDRGDGSFYFGFATNDRVRTAADDSLIVTLTAPADLRGQGPYRRGTLPAGTWTMTGTYSSLYGGKFDPLDLLLRMGTQPIAFMECWDGVWPIQTTRTSGWRGPEPVDDDDPWFLRKLRGERGVNGRSCRSHIKNARAS